MDPNFRVSTPRLYISYLQPTNDSHCDFLVQLYNTPEFISALGNAGIKTREDARKRIEGRITDDQRRNGYGIYLVSLKPQPEASSKETNNETTDFQETLSRCKLIGTVSLMRGDGPNDYKAPDLGFAILPEETRKGYAREASQALMDYAEKELGVHEVLGLFHPENEASKGVFRSLGFEDCGIHTLKAFGGVQGGVWVKKGMSKDVSVYGI